MGFVFPWPISTGEWIAWLTALVTLLLGLMHLFMPVASLRLRRLQTEPAHPEAVAEARGTMSGFLIGLGLASMLLAQPLIYFALGLSWAITVFGRIVSIMSDRGSTPYNWSLAGVELVLALLPIGYAFGFLP